MFGRRIPPPQNHTMEAFKIGGFQSILVFGGCIWYVPGCGWLWYGGSLANSSGVRWFGLVLFNAGKWILKCYLALKLPCQTICQFSSQRVAIGWVDTLKWAPNSTSYMVYLKTNKPKKAESYTPQPNFYLKGYYGGPPRLKLRLTTWVWHFVPGFPTTSTTCQNTRVKQGPARKTLMWFIGR